MDKDLYKAVTVKTCVCYTRGYDLEYYVVNSEQYGEPQFKPYGIEIQQKSNGVLKEIATEYYLFNSEAEVEKFAEMLAKNSVMPSTLKDIVEDYT